MKPQGGLGIEGMKALNLLASDEEIYADETYYVSSGTSWATRNLTVDGVLFIDGEVHVFGDVKGTGAIKGSGILRLEV